MLEGRNLRGGERFDDEWYVIRAALEKFGGLDLSLFDIILDLEGNMLIVHS